MSFNLATMLRESASTAPDAPVLFFGDREIAYREIDEQSGRLGLAAGARARPR